MANTPSDPVWAAQNKGPEFIAIFSVGVVVATILLGLRLWVRMRIVQKVGYDDWVMVASLIVTLAAFGCLAFSVQHGLGKHYAVIAPADAVPAVKVFWAAMFMTPTAEACAKISISLMLIRVTTSVKWKAFFYTLIVLFIAITLITLVADLSQCKPITLLWDPTAHGTCNRAAELVTAYLQGVGAALYDIILATSPIFLFWNVQMDSRNKITLCALLGLAFFTSAAGILRTVYTIGALNIEDFTFTVMDFLIWKAVELPLSIIVGCLPTLRPLFPKLMRFTTSSRPKRYGYQVQEESHILESRNNHPVTRKSKPLVSVSYQTESRSDESMKHGDESLKQGSSFVDR